MRHVSCALCGLDDAEPVLEKDGWRVVRCRGCGLGYVDPSPEPADVARFYDESGFYEERYSRKRAAKLRNSSRNVAAVERALGRVLPRRLLDVGCGCGFVVRAAADRGWEARGVDLCSWEVEYARRELAVDAEVRPFPGSSLPAGSFSAVTMYDVLEHMPDPAAGLAEAFSLLRPGGVLVAAVPDFGHPAARRGAAWDGYAPPQHLFYFTAATLRRFGEGAGFVWGGMFLRSPWKDSVKALFRRPAGAAGGVP